MSVSSRSNTDTLSSDPFIIWGFDGEGRPGGDTGYWVSECVTVQLNL